MSHQITGFVPYIHVQSVLESQAFYEKLGMILDSRFGEEGDPYWARMKGKNSDLMLAKASGPIDPTTQAALFYLYSEDISALREHLLQSGVHNGGKFNGDEMDWPRNGRLFDINKPFYMPDGELRVHDPDGYVLLIGQLG
ncbi:MAG: hypothetical protein JNK63_07520 [Chthonomonas sp.]|nr:hypothetical protein [Chthonomonas sp.]